MIKTCEHLKIDGELCGSPAINDRNYCHFHDSVHNLNNIPGSPDFEMPVLDDPLAIQLFLSQIAHSQICGSINSNTANFLVGIARTATANLRLARNRAASKPVPTAPSGV